MRKSISFAQNLKKLRLMHGISGKQLAKILNVAPTTISTWECGRAFPDVLKLVELCDFFSVSLDEIIFGYNDASIENLTEMQKYIIRQMINEFSKIKK